MRQNDSDQVNDLFAAGTRDCTPAPARHAACVLYAPAFPDPESSRRCASVLSNNEALRAERFVTEESRAHFQQRRAFRRYCGALALAASRPLSQIAFGETENGRPYLPDLPDVWFSFSSCRFGYLGAWSSTHGVGVDIEDQARDLEAVELAQRFFSQAEAKAVEEVDGLARQRTFFQLWSLKEAALKSVGEGLPYGLDAFAFDLVPNLHIVHAPREHGGPDRFEAHLIEGTDSCAALVLRERLSHAPRAI
jgi:phosphopantetheine--protein transferase-like protein